MLREATHHGDVGMTGDSDRSFFGEVMGEGRNQSGAVEERRQVSREAFQEVWLCWEQRNGAQLEEMASREAILCWGILKPMCTLVRKIVQREVDDDGGEEGANRRVRSLRRREGWRPRALVGELSFGKRRDASLL